MSTTQNGPTGMSEWMVAYSENAQFYFHRLFQLRVVPLSNQCRGLLHFDIGRHAAVLHFPLPRQRVIDAGAGRAHETSVHQRGPSGHPHQPAPRARSEYRGIRTVHLSKTSTAVSEWRVIRSEQSTAVRSRR